MTQPTRPVYPAFQPIYLRWLIVVLVILICVLGLLHVISGSDTLMFGLILALCIAVAVP